MIITDSGLHIWRAETPERPWQPGRTAHLDQPMGYEDLSARMAEAGVDRAILIPPSWVTNTAGVQSGLRPVKLLKRLSDKEVNLVGPFVPSHVAYEVGAGRQQAVRSPRTMNPQPQGWHQNREAMVHLLA